MKISDIKNTSVKLTSDNYENIFNIYQDESSFYYYNLLRKVDFPLDLSTTVYDVYVTQPSDTYPTISYKFYKSVVLWWVICAVNQIDNPVEQPVAGTVLKIVKPVFVSSILTKMKQS